MMNVQDAVAHAAPTTCRVGARYVCLARSFQFFGGDRKSRGENNPDVGDKRYCVQP